MEDRNYIITVKKCPVCENSHDFAFKIILNEYVPNSAFENKTSASRRKFPVVLICPVKQQKFTGEIDIELPDNFDVHSIFPE